MDIIYNYIYIDKKKFIQCSIEKEKKSVKTCHHACMLSYIFEKNIYIYMYSRFRIYFLDILNDSLNAFSYRFIYIVAVYYCPLSLLYTKKLHVCTL